MKLIKSVISLLAISVLFFSLMYVALAAKNTEVMAVDEVSEIIESSSSSGQVDVIVVVDERYAPQNPVREVTPGESDSLVDDSIPVIRISNSNGVTGNNAIIAGESDSSIDDSSPIMVASDSNFTNKSKIIIAGESGSVVEETNTGLIPNPNIINTIEIIVPGESESTLENRAIQTEDSEIVYGPFQQETGVAGVGKDESQNSKMEIEKDNEGEIIPQSDPASEKETDSKSEDGGVSFFVRILRWLTG